MKKWEVEVMGMSILVENRFDSERLYVNGQLQDEQIGFACRSRLSGNLFEDGSGVIKVSLGGIFKIHCRIFVSNQLVLSE